MGNIGKYLEVAATRMFNLGEALLKDITPADFSRQPVASAGSLGAGASGLIKTNHPAFVYGHLSLYPARMMEFMGLNPGAIAPDQKYQDLFAHGKECFHDPEGSTYPSMDEIVAKFKASHKAVLEALPGVDDAVFARETPHEGMRARFPTVGSAVTFLLCSHTMMHLGQVSAWRRCMGLGSVM
jgi:hypothetical protein